MRRRSATGSTLAASTPPIRTVPELGSARRLTRRNSVVLPEPEAPTTANNSALATDSDTPSSTGRPSPNRLLTVSAVMAGLWGLRRLTMFGCVRERRPARADLPLPARPRAIHRGHEHPNGPEGERGEGWGEGQQGIPA